MSMKENGIRRKSQRRGFSGVLFGACLLSPLQALAQATESAGTAAAETPPAVAAASQEQPTVAAPSAVNAIAPAPVGGPELERPKSGVAQLVAGGALTGLGVLNLGGLGLCYLDVYPDNARTTCKIASLAVAGLGLGIGIPLLVVGGLRRSEFKAWKEQHPGIASGTLRVFHSAEATQIVFSTVF
jgi:hypothetical protein